MKNIFAFICAIAILTQLATAFLLAQNEQKENIKYQWAFVCRSGDAVKKTAGIITRDTVLNSGDQFKFFVNAEKQTYVYIIYKSSTNEISLLFPYSVEMYDQSYIPEKNYYIPKGREWFTLDKETGEETFYILASSERLTELEKKLAQHGNAEPINKMELAKAVVSEIKNIKKHYRVFSTPVERPVSIAGNVRGTKEPPLDPMRLDIATLASEISAVNFFSKTITIDHK
jgi:hypothetical protein